MATPKQHGHLTRAGRARQADGGQAITEFALIATLVALMLAAVLELGRGWSAASVLNAAVRDGVRLAAVTLAANRNAAVQSRVESSASTYFTPAKLNVGVTTSAPGGEPRVTVTATGQLDMLFGSWLGVGPKISVARTATMRDETLSVP